MNTSPRFGVGEKVVDADADEPGVMIVLDPDRSRADKVTIDALEATVAEVNSSYPADDRVVECIHEEWLERNAGKQWPNWPRSEFPQHLWTYAREWSLSPRTYDYPESRLEPVEASEPSSEDGETTQASVEDWLN